MSKTGSRPVKTRKKHPGRSFFLTLLILIIVAAAVFVVGWLQWRLDENDVAIVHTKMGGYESKVVTNGEFTWRWEALLPTYLTLNIIKLENRSVTVNSQGTLPSGDLYAKVAGEGASFDWKISADITYRLNAEKLPGLISEGRVTSDIETLYADFESDLKNNLNQIIATTESSHPETTLKDHLFDLEKQIGLNALAMNGSIEVIAINITEWTYPDPVLYAQARQLTMDIMNNRKAVISEVEEAALRRVDEQKTRIESLKEYGEAFDEYPVLLDLFALEGNPAKSLLPPDSPQEAPTIDESDSSAAPDSP